MCRNITASELTVLFKTKTLSHTTCESAVGHQKWNNMVEQAQNSTWDRTTSAQKKKEKANGGSITWVWLYGLSLAGFTASDGVEIMFNRRLMFDDS